MCAAGPHTQHPSMQPPRASASHTAYTPSGGVPPERYHTSRMAVPVVVPESSDAKHDDSSSHKTHESAAGRKCATSIAHLLTCGHGMMPALVAHGYKGCVLHTRQLSKVPVDDSHLEHALKELHTAGTRARCHKQHSRRRNASDAADAICICAHLHERRAIAGRLGFNNSRHC
jgi:hypothetical protein